MKELGIESNDWKMKFQSVNETKERIAKEHYNYQCEIESLTNKLEELEGENKLALKVIKGLNPEAILETSLLNDSLTNKLLVLTRCYYDNGEDNKGCLCQGCKNKQSIKGK